MNTPWGKSDSKINIERGVSWVGTPSHGGLAVTPSAALKYLSTEAIAKAEKYGSYYFFEEDCAYAIAFYENPEWARRTSAQEERSDADIRRGLLRGLSTFYADYLAARSLEMDPEGYQQYMRHQEDDRLRREKHPHFVVAAEGDWAQGVPKGSVRIYTADGKKYFLDANDYVIGKRLGEYLVNIIEDKEAN